MNAQHALKQPAQTKPGDQRHVDAFSVRLIAENGSGFEICELRNVSTGGLAIVSPKRLSAVLETTLLIELPLGRSASRVQTRCVVRGHSAQDVPMLHLQFLDQSPMFIATLEACIEAWESRVQPGRGGPD